MTSFTHTTGNFHSTLLTCDLTMFPGKNIQNIAKSSHIFPGKERGDKDFILTNFDSSMAEVFRHYCFFFSILTISRRKRGVKVGPKCKLWVRPVSINTQIFQNRNIFKHLFFCQSATSGENVGNIGPCCGSKGSKTSQKRLFCGC